MGRCGWLMCWNVCGQSSSIVNFWSSVHEKFGFYLLFNVQFVNLKASSACTTRKNVSRTTKDTELTHKHRNSVSELAVGHQMELSSEFRCDEDLNFEWLNRQNRDETLFEWGNVFLIDNESVNEISSRLWTELAIVWCLRSVKVALWRKLIHAQKTRFILTQKE